VTPRSTTTWAWLVQLDRLPEGVERFRRALTIDPNHAGACVSLAETLRHQGSRRGLCGAPPG
jgi:hypothetical protein